MYGLVNRAVKDLIVTDFGEEVWMEIRQEAGVTEDDFIALDAYPDEITYDLVAAASNFLEVSPEELLTRFGKQWILFTSEEGYGEMMDAWGDSVPQFLENLNGLHTRMRVAMPHLEPPLFEVVNKRDDSLDLRYTSRRPGLAPMVIGILEGLGERFGTPVEASLSSPRSEAQDYDVFSVSWQAGPAS